MTVSAQLRERGMDRAGGRGRPVLDAVTGEEVARVSSDGHRPGRGAGLRASAGGPALRELTFHQRAGLLKALGQLLREHRPELYALSARTGATLGDAKFDVDGGIGVLLSYASKARRELPNDTVLLEGAVEPLGRGGTFVGQHILTPLRGVAVQINAFNFPVWGPLEKFAPAFIAGVPSLVKPATQTAYLTARLVELIVDSGLLPEGSLQLVCGQRRRAVRPPRRAGPGVVHRLGRDRQAAARPPGRSSSRSVRFNAEADSLNCSILGPDAEPGTPEFDLYVGQLVTEMTVKAGQKCTAIRRALRPGRAGGPGGRGGPATGWPRWSSATRPPRASRWARWPAWSSARRCAARSRPCWRRRGSCPATPDHVEVVGASAETRRVHLAAAAARRRRRPARAARGRGVRAGQHDHRLPRHRRR